MLNDELSIAICKFFGTIVLFIGTPAIAWIFYSVTVRDISTGVIVTNQTIAGLIFVVILVALAGAYGCRIGFGWFGGKK